VLIAVVATVIITVIAGLRPVVLAHQQQFVIPEHSNAKDVAQLLYNQNMIRSRWLFRLTSLAMGESGEFKAGTYVLSGRVSLVALMRSLANGSALINDIIVTIPEGLRSDQIAKLLAQKQVVSSKEFLQLVRFPTPAIRQQFSFLTQLPSDQGLEGFLFGNTYRFALHSRPEVVLTKLLKGFEAKVIKPYYGQPRSLNHLYSDLILASIVEMEVRSSSDRKLVADIFSKRIAQHIPLQADSTVNYVTGKSDPRVKEEDSLIASPFNTYRVRGLPPSPISNPSTWSIDAVLNPTSNPYFYFLTDEEGRAHFARSFQEHQTNRVKYLR